MRWMYTMGVCSGTITAMIMCQIYQMALFRKKNPVNLIIGIQGNQNDVHIRFAWLDVRSCGWGIHRVAVLNDIPLCIKCAICIDFVNVFKQMLRKHLIDMNMHKVVAKFNRCVWILGDYIIDQFQRDIICKKLVLVGQLLLYRYLLGKLAALIAVHTGQ